MLPDITRGGINEGKTVKCIICEKLTESQKTFTCRRCKKSPFCFEHMDSEYRVCSGCAAEERMKLYDSLTRQEGSIKGFLRLMQFILVITVIFFGAKKFFYELVPEFLKVNILVEHLFLWGGMALGGMLLCYVLILSQRQKIREIEEKIQDHKTYSRYLHR